MKRKILILFILISLSLTTGCWDMVEINQRTFPYTVGIDLNPDRSDSKKSDVENGHEYIVTMSYININGIGKNATQEERVFVVSTPASSIFEARKKLANIVAYPIYFKHLRVMVLGEELGGHEEVVREIMDGLSKDFIINKKLRIATTKGRAQDILEAVPKALKQEEIEGSLFALLKGSKQTSKYVSKTLSSFIEEMYLGSDMVPRMKVGENNDIEVFGGCIFKDYKIIGHLDELEVRTVSFIKNQGSLELIKVPYKDNMISYEILGEKVKRKLITSEDQLTMKIDIETEGDLQQYILKDEISNDDIHELKSMEKAIKSVIEDEVNRMVDLLQKKHSADLIGVGEYISKFHPKVWKEISKDWEEIFSEMNIEINVHPKIRRRGLTK